MTGIADILSRASGSVEDFRGDVEPLAAMMRNSWGQEPAAPFLYTGELLADCLGYPGGELALAPSIYHGSQIMAFVAGCPRRALVDGTERRLLVSAFLTVAPEHKASGYGIVVWSELMRRAADAGFDGVINYCVDGEAMDRMIHGGCRLLGHPLRRVKSFSYLVRLLSAPSGGPPEPGREPSGADLITAASALTGQAELCRLWSEAEARWQLSRLGAVCARAGTDADPAVLTGNVITVADAARTRCLVVNDVLWGGLAGNDRRSLVDRLLDEAIDQGAGYATVPRLGYADLQPFVSAGFLPSPHTMHAYLTLWDATGPDRPVERYYLDVI
jgi:hypothetical protein